MPNDSAQFSPCSLDRGAKSLAILRELRLPTLQRDRSQIIIETLHTGSLDQLRDQSREEVRVSADPGESLREGVTREALTVI